MAPKLIEGKMPKAGGATALFIHWLDRCRRRCWSRVSRGRSRCSRGWPAAV